MENISYIICFSMHCPLGIDHGNINIDAFSSIFTISMSSKIQDFSFNKDLIFKNTNKVIMKIIQILANNRINFNSI